MSVADQGPDYRTFLVPILRQWTWVAITALVGCVLGAVVTLAMPRHYEGSVTFFVSAPMSEQASPLSALQFSQERVGTYVRLLDSEKLAEMVRTDSGVDLDTQNVMGQISGNADLDTVLLDATVQDQDRERAEKMTQSVAQQMPALITELEGVNANGEPRVSLVVVSGPEITGPTGPSLMLNTAAGGVVGLMLGLVLANIASYRQRAPRGGRRAAA